jgi:hypothetical protein
MDNNENSCVICYANKINETKTFVCDHSFCQSCIVNWYKQLVSNGFEPSCPLCKKIDFKWRR